ncbi:hypothetical protein [Methylobacterium komagatae]
MRALLTIICGTVGGVFISAAAITSILFVCTGHFDDLARAAFVLAVWALGFGLAFLIVAFVGHATGVLEPTTPAKREASDA